MFNLKSMDNIFLKGEKIFFRPYQSGDTDLLCQWLNQNLHKSFTDEQAKNYITKEIQSDHNVILVVADKNDIIGLAGLYGIDYIARKAEMKIILGNEDNWKTYGAEIAKLMTFFGFDRLNLNRIYLDCAEDEKKLDRTYKEAGYIFEGIIRDKILRDGRYYNLIRMAILRKDYCDKFYKLHLKLFRQ